MMNVTFDESKWKLVPVEPTLEMSRAGMHGEGVNAACEVADIDVIWADMLAAAPAAPEATEPAAAEVGDDGPEFTVEDSELNALLNAVADWKTAPQNMDTGLYLADLIERVQARLGAPHQEAEGSGQQLATRLTKLTRWTFDGGMAAQVSPEGQWVSHADLAHVLHYSAMSASPATPEQETETIIVTNTKTGQSAEWKVPKASVEAAERAAANIEAAASPATKTAEGQ